MKCAARGICRVFVVTTVTVCGCGADVGGSGIPSNVRQACYWVADEDLQMALSQARLTLDEGYSPTHLLAEGIASCIAGCLDGGGNERQCDTNCRRCTTALIDAVYP